MVGDAWFGAHVRVGMARNEVDRLAFRTGGAVAPGIANTGFPDPHSQPVYDRSDHLAAWRRSAWGDGC
jgi:hypothetical protein